MLTIFLLLAVTFLGGLALWLWLRLESVEDLLNETTSVWNEAETQLEAAQKLNNTLDHDLYYAYSLLEMMVHPTQKLSKSRAHELFDVRYSDDTYLGDPKSVREDDPVQGLQ